MVTVYAIQDVATGRIYVGMTNDLTRRLAEHQRGQSFYTKSFSNCRLVHKEEHVDYKEGRKREKYLKSGCGKEFLKMLVDSAGVV